MFHRNAHITFPCVFHTSSANRNPIGERPTEKPCRARAMEPGETVLDSAKQYRCTQRCVVLCCRVALQRCRPAALSDGAARRSARTPQLELHGDSRLQEIRFITFPMYSRPEISKYVPLWGSLCRQQQQRCFSAVGTSASHSEGPDSILDSKTRCPEMFLLKMAVFWVVAPCHLVKLYLRFRDACSLSSGRSHIALIMEAERTSETTSAIFYQIARRNNLEDSHFHTRRLKNLKSYFSKYVSENSFPYLT
jgi:hypothetical protein